MLAGLTALFRGGVHDIEVKRYENLINHFIMGRITGSIAVARAGSRVTALLE